jgi:hypothetical protein
MAAPEMLEENCGYEGPIHLIFEAFRIEKPSTKNDIYCGLL